MDWFRGQILSGNRGCSWISPWNIGGSYGFLSFFQLTNPSSSIITIHPLPGDQCAVPCTWTWIHPDSSSRAVALMGMSLKTMELSCDINGIFTKHCQKCRCLPKKGNSRAGYETKTLWLSTGEKQTERRLELQSPSWWDPKFAFRGRTWKKPCHFSAAPARQSRQVQQFQQPHKMTFKRCVHFHFEHTSG